MNYNPTKTPPKSIDELNQEVIQGCRLLNDMLQTNLKMQKLHKNSKKYKELSQKLDLLHEEMNNLPEVDLNIEIIEADFGEF